MEYVGDKQVCDGRFLQTPPESICHWGRRASIKKSPSPAYFENFMFFIHFCEKLKELCLLDIVIPHGLELQIVYRFNEIHMFYKPINNKLGQLLFVGPRTLVRALLDDFRRLAKNFHPPKYYRKCQLGRETQDYAARKMIFELKAIIQTV